MHKLKADMYAEYLKTLDILSFDYNILKRFIVFFRFLHDIVSQMDSDQYVLIQIVANFNQVC